MQYPQAASRGDLQAGILKIAVIIGWQARLPEDARTWWLGGYCEHDPTNSFGSR